MALRVARVGKQTLFCFVPAGLLILAGCAGPGAESKIDPNEQRFNVLNEQLRKQEARIERLTKALERLNPPDPVKKENTSERVSDPVPLISDDVSPGIMPSQDTPVKAMPSKGAPSKVVPIEKLVPSEKARDENDEDDETFPDEGESIADSSQESMHWYYEGSRALKAAHYEDAVKLLTKFLGESPEHIYADRAQYLLANSQFRNKEFELAIVATNILESKYPESFRLPDAILIRAMSYRQLGQVEQARSTLRELLKRFPSDPVTDEASRKLAELAEAPGPKTSMAPMLLDETD